MSTVKPDGTKHDILQTLVMRGARSRWSSCSTTTRVIFQRAWNHCSIFCTALHWVNDCNNQVPWLHAGGADTGCKTNSGLTIYPNSILDIFAWMMDHRPQRKCDASAYLQIETIAFNNGPVASIYSWVTWSLSPVGLNNQLLFNAALLCRTVTQVLLCQISSDEPQLKHKAEGLGVFLGMRRWTIRLIQSIISPNKKNWDLA